MSSSSKKGGADPAADVKKFMFDTNDFDRLSAKANASSYTEEQLALAKEQSFALGKAEGAREAQQRQEERLAEILQKASAAMEKLAAAEDRREVEKCAEAVKLATRVAHKLMPRFALQYALPEIESVILQAIQAKKDEPRLAVTVPTAHLDALKDRIDALALEKNFAGKVVLVADDALPPTDCRVEWADGGAERLYERLFTQIDNEFTKALSGMNKVLEEEKQP